VQVPKDDVEAPPVVVSASAIKGVKLSIADVNPFPPFLRILSRRSNVCILTSSGGRGYYRVEFDNSDLVVLTGLLFAFCYSITYTCTLSLHYHYDSMTTGLVLLAYGIGWYINSLGK
jgi:hypothetical protein